MVYYASTNTRLKGFENPMVIDNKKLLILLSIVLDTPWASASAAVAGGGEMTMATSEGAKDMALFGRK